MLPTDFHAKDRDVSSYVNLDTLEIVEMSDIFIRHDRIGIKRFSTEEGFFKKQFITMKNGYSFCFFADLEFLGSKSRTKHNSLFNFTFLCISWNFLSSLSSGLRFFSSCFSLS